MTTTGRRWHEIWIRATPRSVDLVAAGISLALVAIFCAALHLPSPPRDHGRPLILDLAAGLVAAGAIAVHSRWPVGATLVAVAMSPVGAGPASIVALFLLATRRRLVAWAPAAALFAVAGPLGDNLRTPEFSLARFGADVVGATALVVFAIPWGITLRVRTDASLAFAERVEQAARHAERATIAREMHDVLAHRVSMLAMQAGSLTHRRHLSPGELTEGLETIRTSAHEALQDLRGILLVLRNPQNGSASRNEMSQPSVEDIERLLGELRATGTPVQEHRDVDPSDRIPPLLGRTLFRVAGEALDNAARHAPGRAVTFSLEAAPGPGATLCISNPLPGSGRARPAPGTRSGLIGVHERVQLAGGRVIHCGAAPPHEPTHFRVEVWLPWPEDGP